MAWLHDYRRLSDGPYWSQPVTPLRENLMSAKELLDQITAPPLPTFEERVFDLCFELARAIVDARDE